MAALSIARTLASASVRSSQAPNVASHNVTLPTLVSWVSPPPGRDTMSIVWTCVSILLVCTYKCLHLNISSFEENRAGWHKTKRWGIPYWPERPLIRKRLRKFGYMLLIILAPEFAVSIALDQFLAAKFALKKAQDSFPLVKLSLTHAFYANMGGFAAKVPGEGANARTQLFMLDLVTYVSLCSKSSTGPSTIVTTESLEDRSKADTFSKIFAIIQCGWLVVSSIARVSVGLRVTELELATMAYVLCAIIVYGLWWHKPFDIEHVTILQEGVLDATNVKDKTPWREVSNDTTYCRFGDTANYACLVLGATASAFSAIHLAAWNFEFGSPVIKLTWRVFAAAATVTPCVFLTVILIDDDILRAARRFILWILITTSEVVYIVARLGLLVLVVYSFKSMPIEAYEDIQWPSFLPHFS